MVVRFLKWNWKQNFISFGSFNLHTNNDLEFQDDPWWVLSPDYTGYHVNYILQYGWNGYLVIMLPILQNGFIKNNGIVKMVKMENGHLNCSKNNGIVKMVKMENGQINL